MTGRRSISDIGVRFVSDEVKRDHRDLENLYEQLLQSINNGDDYETIGKIQNQFCWEFARHIIAMQLFIFPGTESRALQGNHIASERKSNLAVMGDLLLGYAHLQPTDPNFKASTERVVQVLKEYIRYVARTDLVAIEKALNSEESERMARVWERTTNFIPGEGRDAPFKTIDELLNASYVEVRKAWEQLSKE